MGFFLFYLYRFFASERGTDKEEDCVPLLRGWFPRFSFLTLMQIFTIKCWLGIGWRKEKRRKMHNKSISNQSIFGEYKKPEDRVTAALLHVIQVGGQMVVERLFGDHFDIPSNEINVIPQSYQKQSNPDGEISCDSKYNIFIESKIVPDAINEKQLLGHMALTNPAQCRFLIYLTPDNKSRYFSTITW